MKHGCPFRLVLKSGFKSEARVSAWWALKDNIYANF